MVRPVWVNQHRVEIRGVSGGALGTRTGRRDNWMTDEFPSFSNVFHNILSIGPLAEALEDERL